MFKERSLVFGAIYYIVVSSAIIILGSPLFRVLGFEYAGLVSLFASAHLLYDVAERTASGRKGDIRSTFSNISPRVLFFSTIPLTVSLASAPFIPNCDLVFGLIMYVEIVYPTALIATLFGIHFGWMSKTAVARRLKVIAFWLITFFISLLPGYINPQIFIYGWQYGFFPGFVWDAVMSLNSAYWWSRAIALFYGLHFLLYDVAIIKAGANTRRERLKAEPKYWLLLLLVTTTIESSLDVMGITPTHTMVRKKLNISKKIEGNIFLHFSEGSFTHDEEILLRRNTSGYASKIRALYGITYNKPIDVYVYPSEDMYDTYIGTRSASITKPWLSEVHIAKENLESLEHEIVHAILSDHGSFPFDISWSTGLTEGSAVAAEVDFDGIRNCDEYAARIIQLKLADGVQGIMSFAGFASNASGKSYVLAGSFSKYLIRTYGGERFLRLYHSRNYDEIYGKSLPTLEAEWKSSLRILQTPMNYYDSLRTQFYFDRLSVVNEPCLRRIGRMTEDAEEKYRLRKYAAADSIYELILRESDRLDAIRGRVYCNIQLHNIRGALAILDSTTAVTTAQNRAALLILRGDLLLMTTGDINKAVSEWDEAAKLELSDRSFLSAYARRCLAQTPHRDHLQNYLRSLYLDTSSVGSNRRIQLLNDIASADRAEVVISRSCEYLISREFASQGRLKESLRHVEKILRHRNNESAISSKRSERLFYALIEKKFNPMSAAFSY